MENAYARKNKETNILISKSTENNFLKKFIRNIRTSSNIRTRLFNRQ